MLTHEPRGIFRAWERMRPLYNLILLGLVLLFVCPNLLMHTEKWEWSRVLRAAGPFWLCLLIWAIVANLLYFLGPCSEGLLRSVGVWHEAMRELLFVFGVFFMAVCLGIGIGLFAWL
jgi:hypothetical protein